MRAFMFPHGCAWILKDAKEIGSVRLEKGLGILVFTDEDLARTYAEMVGWKDKTPVAIKWEFWPRVLETAQKTGVAYVVVDKDPDRLEALTVSIEKAIVDAKRQIE